MAVQLESRENQAGVRTLNHNNDIVIVFTGEAFLRNLPYLVNATSIFAQKNLGWTEENATRTMSRALRVSHLINDLELNDQSIPLILDDPRKLRKVPSVLFFKEEGAEPGEYIGVAAQRLFYFQTENPEPGRLSQDDVPTMYQILRAVEQDQRGRNRARSSIQLALLAHPDTRWFCHRTANFLAAYTNTRSESLDQEQSYPWRHLYSENAFAQELIRRVFSLVKGNGIEIEATGVSRNDYSEQNIGIEELRPGSNENIVRVHRLMTQDWAMGPLDALYPLYRVK